MPELQAKTVNPSTVVQTVKPDSGYDGLSQVTVNAIKYNTPENLQLTYNFYGGKASNGVEKAGGNLQFYTYDYTKVISSNVSTLPAGTILQPNTTVTVTVPEKTQSVGNGGTINTNVNIVLGK